MPLTWQVVLAARSDLPDRKMTSMSVRVTGTPALAQPP